MEQLVCIIDLFAQEQQIYQQRFDGKMVFVGSATIHELDRTLVQFCRANNIKNVHLYGQDIFVYEIKASMLQFAQNEYGLYENEIRIEVN